MVFVSSSLISRSVGRIALVLIVDAVVVFVVASRQEDEILVWPTISVGRVVSSMLFWRRCR